ncbi:uncharacterized protein LOC105382252 [Plutella xylostella]|uniref:uncharacterized protein LOC105382252 n=1 Tax=Plutella xylostella TaxID=51655 RepID=UPI00203277A6|nr:uncharacterized protein LOC105382252 [Plutella xylostella]
MNTSLFKNSRAISSCRLSSAKSERDIRIRNVSNLTKQELEDNNYKLLETNLELKKTINDQQNKIKVLTTKLLRITAIQKNNLKKEQKECCASYKSIIEEQNNVIEDLKLTNSGLTAKVRALNVRVCSNKQFSAGGNFHHCSLCAAHPASPYSVKLHRSTAALSINSARSDFKIRKKNYSQIDLKDNDSLCNENKCKTLIEELQQNKIELMQKLQITEAKFSAEISELESEITRLKTDNAQARADLRIIEDDYKSAKMRNKEMYEKTSKTEALCCELKYQLAIEKKKVSELETEVKVAVFSSDVAKTIEKHLCNRNQSVSTASPNQSPSLKHRLSVSDKSTSMMNLDLKDIKVNNDDSGFADPDVDEQIHTNKELQKTITALQTEMDELKLSLTKCNCKSKNTIVTCEEARNTSNEHLNMTDGNGSNDRISRPNVSKNSAGDSFKPRTASHIPIAIPIPAKRKINDTKMTNVKSSVDKENISESKEKYESVMQKDENKEIGNERGVDEYDRPNTKKINKTNNKRHDNSTSKKINGENMYIHETNLNPDEEKDDPPKTFTVSYKGKECHTSPDDTEYEISSISDSPRNILSPGEKKFSMTHSTSYTASDTWDLACLSEGELPHTIRGRHLSIGENPAVSYTSKKDIDHEDVKIEDTLKEISQELERCKHLLRLTPS